MTYHWATALGVAAAVGLVGTPVARRMAIRSGLVNRPKARTPYLGGVAIAAALFCGFLAGRGVGLGGVVVACGAALVLVGLIDDDRGAPPVVLLVAELAAAVIAVVAGVRLPGTGVVALDVAGAVVALVLVTHSMDQLDAMDGVAAGLAAAGSAGALALAVMDGRSADVAVSAALVGACLAFLVFNARPASIYMGGAGSIFIGFTLAAVALLAGTGLPALASVVVPFLLLALPLLDGAMVTVGRLRRRLPLLRNRRDHLSHRLAARGLGSVRATAVLIAVELALAGDALAVGRRKWPAWAGFVAGVVVLFVVWMAAKPARVYRHRTKGAPRLVVWGGVAVVVLIVGLAVPAALAALRSRGPALAGQQMAEHALDAARAGRLTTAATEFAAAAADFRQAQGDLNGPFVSFGLAYPVMSSNLRAVRTVVDVGVRLASQGHQVAAAADRFRYRVTGGAVPVAELAASGPGLHAALDSVHAADERLDTISGAYLLPEVTHAIDRLAAQLGPADQSLQQAVGIARYVPPLFGLDGPRTYFVAMQDDAEARATGGLIGFYGIVRIDDGQVHLVSVDHYSALAGGKTRRMLSAPADYLARYGIFDPADNWTNVNLSPDFPTVGGVITDLYPQSGGTPVDGVIGLDPKGLAAMLRLTGPVKVAGWTGPITAANVTDITLYEAYKVYAGSEPARQAFMKRLVRAVFDKVSHLTLRDPRTLVDVMEPAMLQRHIQLYSTRPAEEAYLDSLGMAGAMPPVRSDMLEFTTQNASANKLDWYLHRSVAYDATIDPGAARAGLAPITADVSGKASITLHNTAPTTGMSHVFLGPYVYPLKAGEYRSFVTLYTPLGFTSAALDGQTTGLQSLPELGRRADATFVDLPSGATSTLQVGLTGRVDLRPGGWYELDMPSQPLINPDQVSVRITVGQGWRIDGVHGARVEAGAAVADFSSVAEHTVWVHVVRS